MTLRIIVNGMKRELTTKPERRLIELLREDLGLTSVKEGCGIGECGACTVVVNGLAVNACLLLVGQLQGADVVTLEGLSRDGALHPLQRAFLDSGAVQCGFCTPGMLMSAYALLIKNPHPDEMQIRTSISGNLCRCTGYKQIVRGIQAAAAEPTDPHED